MTRRLGVRLAALVLVVATPTAFPAGQPDRPSELVALLGDRSFAVREGAEKELTELGEGARRALQQGTLNPDPEIRKRSERILARLTDQELERRLGNFLEGRPGGNSDLPGWLRFQALPGSGPGARKLYAEMYRQDRGLLDRLDDPLKEVREVLQGRCKALAETMTELDSGRPSLSELTSLLFFLTTNREVFTDPLAARGVCAVLSGLAYRPRLVKELKESPVTVGLLTTFLDRLADGPSLAQVFTLALAIDLRESLGAALKASADRSLPLATRAAAVVVVGNLGGQADVARIEPLLADQGLVGTAVIRGNKLTTELKDVVLAALVKLAGQSHTDFGFPYMRAVPGVTALPEPVKLGFARPEDRQAALDRWKKHRPSSPP